MCIMRVLIFLLIVSILSSCKSKDSQEPSNDQNALLKLHQENLQRLRVNNNIYNNIKSMEPNSEKMRPQKFDIDRFNKNNNNGIYRFTTSDSIEVKQVLYRDSSGKVDGYSEHRNYINSPYTYYNEYDASGNLTLTSTSFSEMLTGIGKRYDALGNVIKETDFDAGYPFSIDMLIHKMKEEYGVDLLTRGSGYANRGQDEEYLHIPTYEVYSILEETVPYSRARNNGEVLYYNRTYRKVYLIDGNTGVVLYITDMPLWETGEDEFIPLPERYLNSLKEGNIGTTGLNSNGLNGIDTVEDEDLPEI
jgi:hypothetical protein